MKDYFKVLGVRPGAPTAVIKAAYRALMKIHHPDVGGSTERAQEIEEAYRHLSQSLQPAVSRAASRTKPAPTVTNSSRAISRGHGQIVPVVKGKHLDLQVLELQSNQVFPCPRECSFYHRNCRYKQQLSLESRDLYALRATTVVVRMRNSAAYPQQVNCYNGRAALIDQRGDFYGCQSVCNWQHPPKYKEARVEMFPGTQATLMLWFPQLPSGRYAVRFVYKHKLVVHDMQGDWLDEELMEQDLASG